MYGIAGKNRGNIASQISDTAQTIISLAGLPTAIYDKNLFVI
jgi:hypothetical protein